MDRVSASEAIYVAYLQLRAALVGYGLKWLDEDTCEGLAGEAIAHLVGLAAGFHQTASGPWEAAFNHMRHSINLMRRPTWIGQEIAYHEELPLPEGDFGERLAQVFGGVVDAIYEARLSSMDVLHIQALIAVSRPPLGSECTLMELLTLQRRDLEPLRRVFFAVEEHEPEGTPVCRLSGRIGQRESLAHQRWQEQVTHGKEVSGWLA